MNDELQIKQNQVILPNEKNLLIDAISKELGLLKKDIDDKKVTGAALEAAVRHRDALQNLLNRFLSKKGVITPDETNEALEAMDDSKKIRLQKDYKLGLNRFTFNIVSVIVAGALVYYFIKRRK
jgi:hypothetical protein